MRSTITCALAVLALGITGCGQPSGDSSPGSGSRDDAVGSLNPDTLSSGSHLASAPAREVDLTVPPSDARIQNDVGGNKEGVVSIELQDKRGKKRWSSIHGQYFWERFVVVKREARLTEFPDAGLLVGGWARYEITDGKYHYREFKVAWNEYEGIPRPTDKQALDFIKKHLRRFVGGVGNVLVKPDAITISMASAEEQEWIWHSPNSVSFNVRVRYSKVVSNTEIAEVDSRWQARFYRGSVKEAWQNLMGTEKHSAETGRVRLTAKEVSALPRGVR